VDVSGVRVNITLNHNGSALASASALTDNSGKVSYRYRRAPNGKYTTDINSVSKSGLTYDSALDTADPGLTK
jgi:hypothetical protein